MGSTYGLRKHLATMASADKPEAVAERLIHQDACKRAAEDRMREYPIVTAENFETADAFQKRRIAFWKELASGHGREYRMYSNILWGARYIPDTQAHHCRAESAEEAAKLLNPNAEDLRSTDAAERRSARRWFSGYQSMQVRAGDSWQWVTETPEHLGGIAKHWHGEAV